MNNVIELSKQLINIASVSPEDNGCLDIIIARLKQCGFTCEKITSGKATNLWARYGNSEPVICFAGHTDVVPTGPIEQWQSDPFIATERNGYLFGRGAADMKTGVAAIIIAVEQFITENKNVNGSIALLITSAEEDYCNNGTPVVLNRLQQRGEKIDYCVIGEPSSSNTLGDTIKVGRRGSLHGNLTIKGKQGHIAYPHLADNPIHNAFAVLEQLTHTTWDKGNNDFPPTCLQISNIHAGTGADNIIPGELSVVFNFRFSPESTPEQLQQSVIDILNQHQVNYHIDWNLSGQPFYCQDQPFIKNCTAAIENVTGMMPTHSTAGGTSDGRFIAPTGAHVIEFGVINQTIHQIDECVKISDLEKLATIYQQILINVLK